MPDPSEASAERIAEQGREALLGRLREAFANAAAAHADVLELDADKLERMVKDAAARADGLQWRRALAAAATEELGIGLGEALGHPAVVRAQEIVGAPSYEDGLAAIAQGNAPPARVLATKVAARDGDGAAREAESDGAPEAEARDLDPEESEPQFVLSGDGLPVGVRVFYLEGLPAFVDERALELRFADDGLKIIRVGDDVTLASYPWSELRGVEVAPSRGRILRRRSARVTLTTTRLHGTFEARGVSPEELRERLAPALANVGVGG